jgi:hypothetical protein
MVKKIVLLPNIIQPIAFPIDHHTRTRARHEIRIPRYIDGAIHPRHSLIQKLNDLFICAQGAKLGYPDRAITPAANVPSIFDVLLETVDVFGGVVPVDVDEVDRTAVALFDETGEPTETCVVGGCCVYDGRRTKVCIVIEVCEWFYMNPPALYCVVDGNV